MKKGKGKKNMVAMRRETLMWGRSQNRQKREGKTENTAVAASLALRGFASVGWPPSQNYFYSKSTPIFNDVD